MQCEIGMSLDVLSVVQTEVRLFPYLMQSKYYIIYFLKTTIILDHPMLGTRHSNNRQLRVERFFVGLLNNVTGVETWTL